MNQMFYGTASLTNSKRSKIQLINSAPGPGTYQIQNKQNLPKWTIKPKILHGTCFQNKSITPAPGKYNINQSQKKAISKQKSKQYHSQKYKFCSEKSSSLSLLNIPSSINNKSGFIFGYRDQIIIKQNSPGPIYDVNACLIKSRTTKKKNNCLGFGFGDRDAIYKKENNLPGPGAYSSIIIQKNAGAWSFSKDKKGSELKCQNSLGPGEYNPKMSQTTKSCLIKGRFPEQKKQQYTAAPGSYNIPDTKSKIGSKFSLKQNKSTLLINNNTTSPFSYQQKRYPDNINPNTGYSIGNNHRSLKIVKDQVPGPGAYQVDSKQNNSGGYIGQKLGNKKKVVTSDNFYKYTPNFSSVARQSAKFSFATTIAQWDKKQQKKYLGPGSYIIKQSACQSHLFGKSSRWQQFQKQVPYNKPQSNIYSTIGYMPNYLKKSINKQ